MILIYFYRWASTQLYVLHVVPTASALFRQSLSVSKLHNTMLQSTYILFLIEPFLIYL